MSQSFELAGVAYETVNTTTMERELYVQSFARRSRLDELRQRPDEGRESFLSRARAALMRSAVLPQLLAAHVTPWGRPWSADSALETARQLPASGDRRERFYLCRLADRVLIELLGAGVFGELRAEGGAA